jgi:hypothetical protein
MNHILLLAITKKKPSEASLNRLLSSFKIRQEEEEYEPIDDTNIQRRNWIASETSCFESPVGKIYIPAQYSNGKVQSGFRYYESQSELPFGCRSVKVPDHKIMSFRHFLLKKRHRPECFQLPAKMDGDLVDGFTLMEPQGGIKRSYRPGQPPGKFYQIAIGERFSGLLRSKSGQTEFKSHDSYDPQIVNAVRRDDLDLEAMIRTSQKNRRRYVRQCREHKGWSSDELEDAARLLPIFKMAYRQILDMDCLTTHFHDWLPTQGSAGKRLADLGSCWRLPWLKSDQSLDEWVKAAPPLETTDLFVDGMWLTGQTAGWLIEAPEAVPESQWCEFVSSTIKNMPMTSWLVCIDCCL